MKSFEELYSELQDDRNSKIHTYWQEAKAENSKANKLSLKICLTIDLITALIVVITGRFSLDVILPVLIILFIINLIAIVIVNFTYSKKQIEFGNKYKKIVINKLMSNFYDNLEYYPNKEMPEYIYKKLYYEDYNIYHSEDYLEATLNNKYSIQMAEILTEKEETYKDSDGETKTKTYTRFNGLFAKIIIDKSIKSELKILQNGELSLNERLKMDSNEFEKYFDVKASNDIIGMQLLTSDVMEELVQFANDAKMEFDIYINQNEIYLRFHSGNMFEAGNLKKGALDKDALQEHFHMLNLTYNLSNKLIDIINNMEI